MIQLSESTSEGSILPAREEKKQAERELEKAKRKEGRKGRAHLLVDPAIAFALTLFMTSVDRGSMACTEEERSTAPARRMEEIIR